MFYLKIVIMVIFLAFLFVDNQAFAQSGAIPINPEVLKAVVKINSISEISHKPISGSGFIVSCEAKAGEVKKRIYFLVTNKHMLSDWRMADESISKLNKYIEILFSNSQNDSPFCDNSLKIILRKNELNNKNEKVKMHKNNLVDVGIVYLNEDLKNLADSNFTSFDISYLLPSYSITSLHFDIGSQVFVLGYPYGITSLENNLPIAKFGFIASKPGELFSIDISSVNRKNQKRTVKLEGKLLIIDGLIVPGNSGGPVILPSIIKTRINPETQKWEHLSKPTANLVIGILSGRFGSSGLSYSFSSDYIIETIQTFLEKHNWELVR
jgi:uncharacterized membrane protein (Fun14 family)